MKERPILFSAPMVRALLAGTKTQTRRIVKLPHENPLGRWEPVQWGGPTGGRTCAGETVPAQTLIGHTRTGEILGCPYGQPSDRLWVRETWAGPLVDSDALEEANDLREFESQRFCVYAADGGPAPEFVSDEHGWCRRWTPSIHMPRWASRITLEITAVRVERLQDISEADALAEGVFKKIGSSPGGEMDIVETATGSTLYYAAPTQAREEFRHLWGQINGPDSWTENPWLWVVDFRRINP